MSRDNARSSVKGKEIIEEDRMTTSTEQPSPSNRNEIIPNSVRGAPDELRHAIRKKQNKEVS